MKFRIRRGVPKEYIEIFVLLILSVGAVDDILWVAFSLIVILCNINRFKKCKYPYAILAIIVIFFLSIVFDIFEFASGNRISFAGFAFVIPFVFGGILAQKYTYDEFCTKLEKVIFFVCIASLIGFALLIVAPQVVFSFPVVNFDGRDVYTCGFFNAINTAWNSGPLLKRNCGIGYEPGIFQFVPNLGIAILADAREDLFANRSKGYTFIHLTIYIITVLTTFSTTGVAILAVNLLLYFVSRGLSWSKVIGTVSLLGVVAIPLMNQFKYQIGKLSHGYLYERFEPSIHIIKQYYMKIFGVGNVGFNRLLDKDPLVNGWDIFTNYFLRYGIIFLVIFLYLNFRLLRINKNLFFVVVMTALTESVRGYIPVIFFFYTYAMYSRNDETSKNKKETNSNESDVGLQYSQSGRLSI